jgi:hypothetical protein
MVKGVLIIYIYIIHQTTGPLDHVISLLVISSCGHTTPINDLAELRNRITQKISEILLF